MGLLTGGWVTCDECGRNFRMVPESAPTESGGERSWFSCPFCGHQYVMAVISSRGLDARASLKVILKKLKKHGLKASKRVRLQDQARRLREILSEEVKGPKDLIAEQGG